MKAVVIERPNEVVHRDVEAPAVGRGDVLVRSHAAGLCRTDGIVAKIGLEQA